MEYLAERIIAGIIMALGPLLTVLIFLATRCCC